MKKNNCITPGSFFFIIFIIFVFMLSPINSFSETPNKETESTLDNGNVAISDDTGGQGSILLKLSCAHFDPLQKIPEPLAGLNTIQSYNGQETGYYIIQFDGPVQNSWKSALTDNSIELFDYIPDFAFIIRMAPAKEKETLNMSHVRWLGIYQPSYRISTNVFNKFFKISDDEAKTQESNGELLVTVFPGVDLNRIKLEIESYGGVILDSVSTKWSSTLKIKIKSEMIMRLPQLSGIKWIDVVPEWKLFNDKSSEIMNIMPARMETHGLYGEGQTVGICDTGLDAGSTDPASLHDDFEDGSGTSRVIELFDLAEDGQPGDLVSGHGTHVAGSVLGNGFMSGSDPLTNDFPSDCFAGIAPKANLVFQAMADDSTGLNSPNVPDIYSIFKQAQEAGSDLHTNSWGNFEGLPFYDTQASQVDAYMWDNPDFLVLFAAGNEGIDINNDGIVDAYSVGSPGTSKNCLTVGASEGNRPEMEKKWGDDSDGSSPYPVDPILSDLVADAPQGMAAFSGRGPVMDGRYKPDIVAPGTFILSTRSSVATETLWGEYENTSYIWAGGTSMATPLVAGAAAIMREYLIKEEGFSNPSGALIKAALINSAADISPGQYGIDQFQEIPEPPVPNNIEGWGRLNLGNGIYPEPPLNILYFDSQDLLNTDESVEYKLVVSDTAIPLKINLVWTDYPGSPETGEGLVNDLDLEVIDPQSGSHYPDNAVEKHSIELLSYAEDYPDLDTHDKWAIRCTPSLYPAHLLGINFNYDNPQNSSDPVTISVYDVDESSGLPGEILFSTQLQLATGSWNLLTRDIQISDGDFYIVFEKSDPAQSIYVDQSNPTGRGYWHDGSQWIQAPFTPEIIAIMGNTVPSESFDRVNNVEGLTLTSPLAGTYTVRITGHNIPQGPQPFALVASGGITESGESTIQFTTAEYSVNEEEPTATVTVSRTGTSEGEVSVTCSTSDGTATADSDYIPADAILTWEDGDSDDKTFTVSIIDDVDAEDTETINLSLSNPSGAILGTPEKAVLNVVDNDTVSENAK